MLSFTPAALPIHAQYVEKKEDKDCRHESEVEPARQPSPEDLQLIFVQVFQLLRQRQLVGLKSAALLRVLRVELLLLDCF